MAIGPIDTIMRFQTTNVPIDIQFFKVEMVFFQSRKNLFVAFILCEWLAVAGIFHFVYLRDWTLETDFNVFSIPLAPAEQGQQEKPVHAGRA
jgi:hypothetical protein